MRHEECTTSECYWYYEEILLSGERSVLLSLFVSSSFPPSLDVKTFSCFPFFQVLTLSLLVWAKVVRVQFSWRHFLVWQVCLSFRIHPSSFQEYVEEIWLVFSDDDVIRRTEWDEVVEMWPSRHTLKINKIKSSSLISIRSKEQYIIKKYLNKMTKKKMN